ncbi:MAG: ATP-binding cassette domain-containing protein [Desulfovibrio sp.]|jgi:molybdate transport system ATP-binding protein|nr:ATP-binding cassette domain-containing protein [Desulfovibrio sp.]
MKKTSYKPGEAAPIMARLERVYAGYSRNPVFSDLSLELRFGKHLALVGANGSGKSTLLSLLHGDLRPAQDLPDRDRPGKIFWYFEGVADPSPLAAREHTRLVSPAQQRRLVKLGAAITGREIILSGLDNAMMLYGEVSDRDHRRVSASAEAVGARQLLSLRLPSMSQGQLRLCLILRALAGRPRLLLLDEPFDGLDAEAGRRVACSLELAAESCTLLASSHRTEDIPSFMREMLMLRNGRVTRLALRGTRPYRRDSPAVSDPVRAAFPGPPVRAEAGGLLPLLRLEHVNVYIDGVLVLHDINWTVQAGENWLLSGPNGSGKSSLLRLIYGDEQAALGGIVSRYGGKRPGPEYFTIANAAAVRPAGVGKACFRRQAPEGASQNQIALEELRRSVGYVSDRLQDLYEYDLSAEDTVISGLRGSIGLYGEPERDERELARSRLRDMGILHLAEVPLHSLSTGNARKVMLARALVASPPLLLLDEPCSGLDPESRERFLDSLRGLAQRGVSLIYVSHRNDRANDIFTHELRLERGRIVYAGPRSV